MQACTYTLSLTQKHILRIHTLTHTIMKSQESIHYCVEPRKWKDIINRETGIPDNHFVVHACMHEHMHTQCNYIFASIHACTHITKGADTYDWKVWMDKKKCKWCTQLTSSFMCMHLHLHTHPCMYYTGIHASINRDGEVGHRGHLYLELFQEGGVGGKDVHQLAQRPAILEVCHALQTAARLTQHWVGPGQVHL